MVDNNLKEVDPTAIHIMQVIIGPGPCRLFTLFLKSLVFHHFKAGSTDAAPLHLHLVTDNTTRVILEGILGSWRIPHLKYTMYPFEPIAVSFK